MKLVKSSGCSRSTTTKGGGGDGSGVRTQSEGLMFDPRPAATEEIAAALLGKEHSLRSPR